MPNYLKMPKKSQVLALLELGWTYRRIEAETGVRRETVSRYDCLRHSKAAKVFPGSEGSVTEPEGGVASSGPAKPAKVTPGSLPQRSSAAPYQNAIIDK